MAYSATILPRRVSAGLLILVLIAYVGPLLYVLATSLKTPAQVNKNPAGLFFIPTFQNYVDSFTPDLLRATGITVSIALGTTAIVMALAMPAAFAISRLRGRAFGFAIACLLVFQLVPAAATLIPQYSLLFQFGLLNTIPGLIAVDAAAAVPFAVLLLVPFCAGIPTEVLDASEVDGVGNLRLLRSVVLPLTRNGALVVGVLTFITAWGEFIAAVTFINDPALQPLSLALLQSIGANVTNYGTLTATAVLASLPLLVIYLFVQRQMRDGLTVGAVR
ncbi:carbohydrate ABC transporter permease [Leifsonia sp. AG29]|uniref:carbohydrate ABC transporter permease n=1 Tax=Leifsonia sp. AG29 TaxID=2598860 RepID=UPI00131B771E|nr:carbohydrate ABC transporter permease [Leifsonia sp. AG29]